MAAPGTLPSSLDSAPPSAIAPHLFVALRSDAPLAPPSRHVLEGIARVLLGRGNAAGWRRETDLEIRLPDGRMSSQHAVLKRVMQRWVVEDAGSRNGTFVNGVQVERAALNDGDVIELGQSFFVYREQTPDASAPRDVAATLDAPPGLRTLSPVLAVRFAALMSAARSREPILVLGESGTGKELIARAVHDLSERSGDLVAVNCGALAESMLEAELFGHKKGAFSGAQGDRPGLVRSADKGTLFLDEIGDLRLQSQAALLRVLQENEVLPVGAERPISVDLRVVSATHRGLEAAIEAGTFRGDLFARLRGFVLDLPPLRARREDVGLLLAELLRRRLEGNAEGVTLSATAARALLLHAWPFNVRELDRVLGSALAQAAGGPIRLEHLPPAMSAPAPSSAPPAQVAAPPSATSALASSPPMSMQEAAAAMLVELRVSHPLPARKAEHRELLVKLLVEHEGNVAAVARVLDKGRTQVHRWMASYGIDPAVFRL
jgi:transcriptional regulator with GAF, ATPase, and Fis domain